MALVSVISLSIVDYAGNKKSLPIYVPATTTLAAAQVIADKVMASIDQVIDGQIIQASVQLGLTLETGIKASPVTGNLVNEGALLQFSATGSSYAHSAFVPSWSNAFFNDMIPLAGVELNAVIGAFVDSTDKDGNALAAFREGIRKFRK